MKATLLSSFQTYGIFKTQNVTFQQIQVGQKKWNISTGSKKAVKHQATVLSEIINTEEAQTRR